MPTILGVYRFLSRRLFFQLLLASLITCAVCAGRVWLRGSLSYAFMVWNLFLAWVPYLFALWADSIHVRHPGRWRRLLLPGALWLAFLPNALYMVTDLAHLHWRDGSFLWYDTGMLAAFAWSGCFLAVTSLRLFHEMVQYSVGRLRAGIFVLLCMGLTGAGVYIGRVLRWNSWDVLRKPLDLLADILAHAPRREAQGITLLFAAIFLICYLTFPGLKQEELEFTTETRRTRSFN
jgi:uncharacterized membrane protein